MLHFLGTQLIGLANILLAMGLIGHVVVGDRVSDDEAIFILGCGSAIWFTGLLLAVIADRRDQEDDESEQGECEEPDETLQQVNGVTAEDEQ